MGRVTIAGFVCDKCGYRWVPRGNGTPPKVCPMCKSREWNGGRAKASA